MKLLSDILKKIKTMDMFFKKKYTSKDGYEDWVTVGILKLYFVQFSFLRCVV